MNDYARCGVWYGDRGQLVAVVVDTEGRCHKTPPPPLQDSDRWDWLDQLWGEHGLDVELVLPESVGRSNRLGRLALEHGIPLWLAPDVLVDAIREAALARPRLATVAAVLARLPDVRAWRAHLRRVRSLEDHRQLVLL